MASITLPAALSIACAVIGLFSALLALGLSTAPGWRELRWFAACATFAALFSLVNAPISTSHASAYVYIVATRLNLFFAGLHAITWFNYVAASEKRALSKLERRWMLVGLVIAVLTLLPGVVVENRVATRTVTGLGLAWSDAPPTPFGFVAIGFYVVTITWLFLRATFRVVRGHGGVSHAIALGAVTFGGAHDALVTAGVLHSFYILDFALLVLVLSVGGSITTRFVAGARELEASSRKLADTQHELVHKERLAAIGELAAVVAHEVRNPLAVIFNATAGLRRERVEASDRQGLVSIIQEEAERLRDIVTDLLEFARPRPPTLDEVYVVALVRGAVDTACSAAGIDVSNVRLEVASEVGRAMCDARLVRQAIVNLVSNALHAEGRREPVLVSVLVPEDTPDMVAVRVADDGHGVADEVREQIFMPFFSTRPKGTGLGLTVVRRCADAHRGTISLAETPGGGATFELRLPQRGRG